MGTFPNHLTYLRDNSLPDYYFWTKSGPVTTGDKIKENNLIRN
jgi:hypothetical protein